MKKKFISLSLVLIMLISLIPNYANAQQPIKILINGAEVKSDVAPFIENNVTMVPIRVISENLGYEVKWNSKEQSILIAKFDNNSNYKDLLYLYINKPYMFTYDTNLLNAKSKMEKEGKITAEESRYLFNQAETKTSIAIAPKIVNGSTFVPLRLVAESFGLNVNWDSKTRTVTISEDWINDDLSDLKDIMDKRQTIDLTPEEKLQVYEESIKY